MNLNNIAEKVSEILETGEPSKIEEFADELLKELKGVRGFEEQIEKIEELDIPFKNKIKIFLNFCNIKGHDSFRMELMPEVIRNIATKNKEEFLKLITEDESVQSAYAQYYKTMQDSQPKRNLEYILNLPKFKEIILNDEEYISNKKKKEKKFFQAIPKEYRHLIALYDTTGDKDSSYLRQMYEKSCLEQIYEKNFGDCLSKEEQEELINLQFEINSTNMLQLSQKDRMKDLEYVLQQLQKDKDFYTKMKKIQEKTQLNLKAMIAFAHKYNDTELYEQLAHDERQEMSNDMIEKIQYLANNGRITNIEEIKNLETITLEELEEMEKYIDGVSKAYLHGGPQSRKMDVRIFKNSDTREVRRIDKDGKCKIQDVSRYGSHEDAVRRIYEGDIEFPKECVTAIERSIEAVKQLSSMTYVIENEQCFISIPSDISIEQKKASKNWLDTMTEDGILGIFVYDRQNDMFYVANDGDELDKQNAENFIFNLNGKITAKELDEFVIGEKKEDTITVKDLAQKALTEETRSSTMQKVEQKLDEIKKEEKCENTDTKSYNEEQKEV